MDYEIELREMNAYGTHYMPEEKKATCLFYGLLNLIRHIEENKGKANVKTPFQISLSNDCLRMLEMMINTAIMERKDGDKKEFRLTHDERMEIVKHMSLNIIRREVEFVCQDLEIYRKQGKVLSTEELTSDKGKDGLLRRYMRAKNMGFQPSGTHAHHIVSRGHDYASPSRRRLAKHKIRIDDPVNGVFLPGKKMYVDLSGKKGCKVNHNEIHTNEYYINVRNYLSRSAAEDYKSMCDALKEIALRLDKGEFKY